MLGLVQLATLVLIRDMTQRSGEKVLDLDVVKHTILRELCMNSREQATVTISRLKDKGYLVAKGTRDIRYSYSTEAEKAIDEALSLCDWILRHK
jgi:hypothetical protein